ncbi:hypothetical protein [Maritimibacter sp. UBA3975]|uniref:hypothetical protein n=1 Tax=Maritimibacter sp. UBA3975 TaxID=1946833 RepID=UPI000C08E253|nr:hypothetical protein [Maritimibacter sp. UBA3975]MAM62764.1 hypothetical protein [Maritimibacter sp.]|tara:strand:- start:7092 stop:7559 length:468 start_codon:yes stop_codon:yes gene_type:complete
MKVRESTPDLLVVEYRPVWMGLGLIAFILGFVVFGIAILSDGDTLRGVTVLLLGLVCGGIGFGAFVRRAQAVFHRPEGWVEIRRRSVFGTRKVRHDLSEISRAVVESLSDSARVSLVIDAGESAGTHPITTIYSSGDKQPVADAINDWLTRARAP